VVKKHVAFFLMIGLLIGCAGALSAKPGGGFGLTLAEPLQMVLPTTNFFAQKTDERPVENPDPALLSSHQKVAENEQLALYLKTSTLGIAVVDKRTGYTWFSHYPHLSDYSYTSKVNQFVESGVTIEYYDSQTLNEATEYVSNVSAVVSKQYTMTPSGFIAALHFTKLGIKFNVEVSIDEEKLHVLVPVESVIEEPYQTPAMKFPKEYRLKAITLFPYFGSNNHRINGYSMIPDGSGALIRYNEEPSQTAWIKRIYGDDFGIQTDISTTPHIKGDTVVTIPVFGINHGYHQAAFLADLVKGSGAAEIHSYPYKYNNMDINTTFFKYLLRDKFLVRMRSTDSSGIALINTDPYPFDFEARYTFLSGMDADYSGMAKVTRDLLALSNRQASDSVPLRLEVIMQDFKPGLFGKTFVPMTRYEDVQQIVSSLKEDGVGSIEATLVGWTNRGFFDDNAKRAIPANRLGGTKAFSSMRTALEAMDVRLYVQTNPMIVFHSGVDTAIIKKTNLSLFETSVKSSLNSTAYYNDIARLSQTIGKEEHRFDVLGIDGIHLSNVGSSSFSYRSRSTVVYREAMIELIRSQIDDLSDYQIAMNKPNGYLLSAVSSYYDAPYESGKYAYITDSIPFLSLVLSGSMPLYSPFVNYASDYELMTLRIIEYGLSPSFLITKQPTHLLRNTNFEYVGTSEFALWRGVIGSVYQSVNDALATTAASPMIRHDMVEVGIAKITYQNGVVVYVNHTDSEVTIDSVVVPAQSAKTIGGG